MNTQLFEKRRPAPAVKIGTSRQVVIPKKIHDKLGLGPGDFLEVALEQGKVVLTPKTLVDKQIEARITEGREDFQKGRMRGPFSSAKELVRSLREEKKGKRRETAR